MVVMSVILTACVVFVLLFGSELWWRRKQPHSELSRKFIHITVGTFVAFWPFFLSWNQIRVLALGFIIVVAVSKWLNVFQSIHSVQRPTWGEIFFALVVGLLTFVTHSKAIYAVSLLQMSLADGFAAIVGVQYGKRHRYYVFGHPKSVQGTAMFAVSALVILIAYSLHSHHLSALYIAGLVGASTLAENVAAFGLDNLIVPLLIALVLENMH
jgi:phytol kinase